MMLMCGMWVICKGEYKGKEFIQHTEKFCSAEECSGCEQTAEYPVFRYILGKEQVCGTEAEMDTVV